MRVVLASASPRRRELLAAAGFDVDVDPIIVDETRGPVEAPAAYVERLARSKAQAAAGHDAECAVIGADTVVVVDDDVLGKPRDAEDAARMLRRLAGRAHEVLTGVAVVWRGRTLSHVERTTVWFARLSENDIAWYVASGEPMDKAGAYAIQALASRFVRKIDGSYSNVVGLPVAAVIELLQKAGVPGDPPEWGRVASTPNGVVS
ncbi:MAG TPA: Maf family protein [Vicinamibacterales bacterium]|nr:Maf family protein [Vicinamibacterales bacterium]